MTGRSGRAGTADKGDVEVEFEEADAGGIVIDIVPADPEEGSTDGACLETAATELLADFEVTAAKVTVRDHCAPDWVLKARLETALRRAGVGR